MILGVHHPAISVPDMAAAIAFYCDGLGFEPMMQAELPSGLPLFNDAFALPDAGCKVAMLKKGGSCIELFEFLADDVDRGNPERPLSRHGISHFCLVTDDFEADHEILEKAGARFNSAPVGATPMRWVYCRDPFGNVIELLEHDANSPTAMRTD